jgi:hypothetical protein
MADHHGAADGHVHAASAAAGHEVTDAPASPLAKVGIAIAVLMVVSFVGVLLLFRFLVHVQPLYDKEEPAHPLRDVRVSSTEPRLQPDPPREKAELRRIEDQLLTTYDWVDKEQGLVRIPVDRAIDLLSRRGLPEKTGTGAAVTEADSTGAAAPPASEE